MILVISILLVGCSENKTEDNTTTTSTTEIKLEESSNTETTTHNQTETQTTVNNTTTTTTKKHQSNSLISDENIEKIENSNAEVFFTDNPDNKHIIAVSQKYGVKKENLVALIKVNAEFPSATVLEFSGKKDADGELVMTYAELQNVYDINEETNVIIKASKSGLNNDGVNFVESKIYIMLAKEYFIPELPNLKENKRYEE